MPKIRILTLGKELMAPTSPLPKTTKMVVLELYSRMIISNKNIT